jgi:hypothetical protein
MTENCVSNLDAYWIGLMTVNAYCTLFKNKVMEQRWTW